MAFEMSDQCCYKLLKCDTTESSVQLMTKTSSNPTPSSKRWVHKSPLTTQDNIHSDCVRVSSARHEWLNDPTLYASRTPDARVHLSLPYHVSLYESIYDSLDPSHKLSRTEHHLRNMSAHDIKRFKYAIGISLRMWKQNDYGSFGRMGIDWSAILQGVVDRYGDRLTEMKEMLGDRNMNVTDAISQTGRLAFAMLMPYVDFPTVLSDDATPSSRRSSLSRAHNSCRLAFTNHFYQLSPKLTESELKIKDSIEGVLERVCYFATGVLGDSLEFLETKESNWKESAGRGLIVGWKDNLGLLMEYLDWPMWQAVSVFRSQPTHSVSF